MTSKNLWNISVKLKVSEFPHANSIKDTTPNVDYFTRDDLKQSVRDFKDHINNAEDDVSQ